MTMAFGFQTKEYTPIGEESHMKTILMGCNRMQRLLMHRVMKETLKPLKPLPPRHCAYSLPADGALVLSDNPMGVRLMERQLTSCLLLWLLTQGLFAAELLFPADAGFVNVKNPPYSAKGDGVTGDTAAIQAPILEPVPMEKGLVVVDANCG